ncbi:MAG TPA: anthrone oxygenase family protein [Solirubrobacteraceae bacterium]
MSRLVQYLTFATALGCGLSAGVFFAFSSFVMPALDRLAPAQSIRAMHSINKLAVTPVFMTALFGTALACVALGVWSVASWGGRPATLALAGCALFLVGAIVVTMAANVPLNDALMKVDPEGADAATRWSSYLSDWAPWNHVRAVTALAASGLLIAALRLSA